MRTLALFLFAAAFAFAQEEKPALRNMSVRFTLGSEGISVGFVATTPTGTSTEKVRVLVRAITTSLRQFGLAPAEGATLHVDAPPSRIVADLATNARTIAEAEASVGAFPRQPGATGDAAVIVEMPVGSLTVGVRGVGRGGDVIIEAYQLPST